MMVIEEKEDFVEIKTDEDMREKLTEFMGNMTDENWVSITDTEDGLYRYSVKPKDDGKTVSELRKMLERRLH